MLFKLPVANKIVQDLVLEENYLVLQIHWGEFGSKYAFWAEIATGQHIMRVLSSLSRETVIQSEISARDERIHKVVGPPQLEKAGLRVHFGLVYTSLYTRKTKS